MEKPPKIKWSTAIVIGVNEQDTGDAKVPNREMRFLQFRNPGNAAGGGIAWGMAPRDPNPNGEWNSGAYSKEQYLLKYDGYDLRLVGNNVQTAETPIAPRWC